MPHEEASGHAKKEGLQLSLPAAIVFGALVIAGAILIAGRDGAAGAGGNASINIRPPSAEDHIIGSPNAPVVIVEYADLQCPYCGLIRPSLQKIVSESNGKIAWVFRNLPLESIHPEARPAAEAAECVAGLAGNDAFWKFEEAVFADQQHIGATLYVKSAAALGIDSKSFLDCIAQKRYTDRITSDSGEAVANGAQGTPFTVVVGKKGDPIPFSGALPYEQILAVIKLVQSRQ